MSTAADRHLSLQALHAWFDGDRGDEAAARHLERCAACVARLQALSGQRGALLALSEPRASTPWSEAAERAGRDALADLLAAVIDGCLATDAGAGEALRRQTQALDTLRTRLVRLGARLPLDELPTSDELSAARLPDHALAGRCLRVLAALEGDSGRVRSLADRC